jgi:hypothetical protein
MNRSFNTPDGSQALQPSSPLGQYDPQQDNYSLLLGSPSPAVPDMVYLLYTQSNVSIELDLPVSEFMFPPMSPAMPPVTTGTVNDPDFSSSMNPRHTKKTHPCHQCGRAFTRRELAEGCENRHQNLRPFLCTKHCGDNNWYVTWFFYKCSYD